MFASSWSAQVSPGEAGRGSHCIFFRDGVEEIVNIQPRGGQAKPYQVRQVRDLLLKYQFDIE